MDEFSFSFPRNEDILMLFVWFFLFFSQVFKHAFIPRNLDQVIDHEREFVQKQSGVAVEVKKNLYIFFISHVSCVSLFFSS